MPLDGTGNVLKDFQAYADIRSKLDVRVGLNLAKYINSTVVGTQGYFFMRNTRFRMNMNIANGRIEERRFQDRLNFNGQVNYINLNWSSIKVANTLISRMVARWMGRGERVDVQAVDPLSQAKRQYEIGKAEYFLQNKELLKQEQEATGMQLIPQDQFVPEDKDELEEWASEFNRLPEEIKYSLGVNTVLSSNGLYGSIKEKICHDSAQVGLIGTYTYMNEEGEIVVERLIPFNIIYSFSNFDDFRDTTWRGYKRSLKISEIRAKYGIENGGKLTEYELFQIAQQSKEFQLVDKITWLQEWNVAVIRPYDEWNVDTIEFEIKSYDTEKYTVTKTKEKNNTIVRRGVDGKIKENQKVVEDKTWNIYRGVFVVNTEIMLEWGLKKNMIRPHDPKEIGNAEFSYSFYMYQNFDMRNIAVPEKIEVAVEQMQLAVLKIQQLVAKLKPIGAAVNIDALQAIDLGLAQSTTPLEIKKIYEQTGDLYYRGRDAEGNFLQQPITELANSAFLNQVQGLVQIYQTFYQVLQNELGENPNISSQIAQPRVTAENANAALQSAELATEHMYDAVLHLLEDTGRKVACLLHDSVTYGAKKYREIIGEEDIKGRVFRADIKMLPTQEDIARLEAMMNNMILSDKRFILYVDPFKLKRIAKQSVELAETYFRRATQKYLRGEQDIAMQNSQANAQAQVESIQEKAAADAQFEQIKQGGEMKKVLLQGILDIQKQGGQLSPELLQISQIMLSDLALKLNMEAQSTQQAAQEMQMAQQEEAMMQEMGAEQQDINEPQNIQQ